MIQHIIQPVEVRMKQLAKRKVMSVLAIGLCKPTQQSWFSWLQGNSRSTQFHFVDLLELLNRFDHRG
jgi:hypothetical protein